MTKKIAIVILVLITVNAQAQHTHTLTLKQAIDTGIANNLQVNQAGLLVQRNEINWKQSRAFMLPDLNAFAYHGLNQGRSIDPFTNQYINQNVTYANYGANTSLLLFQGLSLQNQIKSNRYAFEASQKEWQQARDNLTINILLAYLQVLSAQEVLEQSKQQITVSNKQVDRLNILNNQGAITPSELYDLKGQVANDQLSVSNNTAALASAKLNLCQLLNIPYQPNLEIEKIKVDSTEALYSKSPDDIYQSALRSFAEIEATQLRTESAEAGIKAATGKLFPILSLGGNLNTNYSNAATQPFFVKNQNVVSDDYVTVGGQQYQVNKSESVYNSKKINFRDQLSNNLFTTISLNLNIPLFNANKVKNQIRLARLDMKNSQLLEKSSRTALQQAIEKAYVEMINAKSRMDILKEQVSAFQESFNSAEVRFNLGAITSVDYLIAKNNLDQSRINLILSKYDLALRKKVLQYYEGERVW